MMHQQHCMFKYYEDSMNQILEMDYSDVEYTFGIILPRYGSEMSLTHEQYEYYISQLIPTHIHDLQMPKFKQQSRFKIDNLFKKMGFRDIFTNADFSDITPSNNILYVSDIIHQAVVIINEDGDSFNKNKINNTSKRVINVIANHPFIYYIRYIPTNTILIVGYYY